MTAREAAVVAIQNITDKKQASHRVVRETLDLMGGDARERALCKRLTEGTAERLISIDYVINSFSKTPVEKMKPLIRAVMRTGAYQLLFMDGIPASAACNESVKIVKKHGLTGLGGFVNGVLRKISTDGKACFEKGCELKGLKGKSVKYSVPEWLLRQWQRDYGAETLEKIAMAQCDASPLYFRVNLSKCTVDECKDALEKDGIICEKPVLSLPGPFENAELPVLRALSCEGFENVEAFRKGWFVVQDVSSMLVGYTADVRGGERILDLCAAPGGKTMQLRDMLDCIGKGGTIDARDITSKKISLINENLNRCSFENVNLSVGDATVFDDKLTDKYDLVIADVPCSGTGVTGRKPDIKLNMNEETQKELIELQIPILENAARYVKKGGKLIFSTCTLNRAENESGMKLLSELGLVKKTEIRMIPGVHSGDGFFISLFIRE